MTLYWYMHWFWITGVLHASYCNIISSTMLHSILGESARSTTKKEVLTKTDPPIYPAGTSDKKLYGKHKSLASSTMTNGSIVEDDLTRTIEEYTNSSDPVQQRYLFRGMLNAAVNHSMFNDSLLYFEEEHSNNSLMANFERITNSSQLSDNLSAAGITGITLGCVSIVGIILALSYILYRNRGFNRPQVLNDHCSNLDSSGYIDDTSDNSEEMYSLDNDSFLNSLEAMTIQNYWTDTVKHTKL
ncbi:hypothetical protein QE152_g507 [Popillia japonica]|uniref:Uncharacterized protein n=1 Tax=Popillia japonica TaxID=7064 RepID=A0AAW1NI04_POPJA